MIRVAISVEGQTEYEFCQTSLNPYFREFDIELTPIIVSSKREKCGTKHRGGCINIDRVCNEIKNLLSSFDHVTTFYDLYAFKSISKDIKVEDLEEEIFKHFNSSKLIPYVQKYEFETLLFSEPSYYQEYFEDEKAKIAVEKMIISCGGEVENVNNSKETAPSQRIIQLFHDFDESYDKVFHGSAIIEDIGLEKVMQECKRFKSWIDKIKVLKRGQQ